MRKDCRLRYWVLAVLVGPFSGCGFDATTPRAEAPHVTADVPDRTKPIDRLDAPVSDPFSTVPEPSPSEPVTAALTSRFSQTPPGATGELVVAVRIARAHYLHAEADHGGRFTPLQMEATLPAGVEFVGGWSFPQPEVGRAGVPVYRNSVLLRRSMKVTSPPPQTLQVTGVLRYQACNEELCWPPGQLELSTPLSIQAEATR